MRGIKKYIILLLVGSAAFAALFAYMGFRAFHDPNETMTESVFMVPKGQGLIRTARILHEEGLITDQNIFKAGVMLKGQERNLKAGEFLIADKSSMDDILSVLVKGEVIQHSLTIPEGWTSYQITEYLNELYNLTDPLEAMPIEGSILPETYNYTYGTSRIELLQQMQKAQSDLVDELWEGRDDDLPIDTKEDAIILASIVERETGIAGERAHVAGAFMNRLRRGIRLQSDPTIIYGIDPKGFLGRGLRRSEIADADNPYNTYQINRLPPGPIAHPGRESIEAVLHPLKTEDIYFVADGSGGHVFAKTLAQHKKNVVNWRKIEAANK
ncbi:MAG: endolytic transglycosylase MltG [Emcibacteraceae bacterium]|nr:endolytic transglycosylase MltG [Emcibacteraceae bacterium]